jgi:hypothetical protein
MTSKCILFLPKEEIQMFQSSDKTKQEGKHGIKRGIKHAL